MMLKRFLSIKAVPVPSKQWKPAIGLEVHAQIASNSKLFSRAPSGRSSIQETDPNQGVSCFDAALPGTLPVLNKACAVAGVKSALALNCHLNMVSKFDRKHYFYFDLPAGYQITQQRQPLGTDGFLDFYVYDAAASAYRKRSEIVQLQLEQDSGRSLHHPEGGATLIDLSRAGSPLIEFVFKPDLTSGLEAVCLIRALGHLLDQLGVCRGRMELGELRVDANVSVGPPDGPLGVRTEIKNVNSAKYVQKAIDFEIARQITALTNGQPVINQTMHYDYRKGVTFPTRDKERLHDYRFLPEPNLPPLRLYNDSTHPAPKWLNSSQVINVEQDFDVRVIAQKHLRLVESWMATGSDPNWSLLIQFDEELLSFVERSICDFDIPPALAVRFCWNELRSGLKSRKMKFSQMPLTVEMFSKIVQLHERNLITTLVVKKLFLMCLNDQTVDFEEIIQSNGWHKISDEAEIREKCKEIFVKNPLIAKDYSRLISETKKEKLKNRWNSIVGLYVEPEAASVLFDELLQDYQANLESSP